MKKISIFLAALAVSAITTTSQAGGDPAAGEAAAAGCAGCHGAKGEGVPPNPKLTGLSEEQFIKAMNEYKDGTRSHALMNGLSASLSEQDIANLAAYYATL